MRVNGTKVKNPDTIISDIARLIRRDVEHDENFRSFTEDPFSYRDDQLELDEHRLSGNWKSTQYSPNYLRALKDSTITKFSNSMPDRLAYLNMFDRFRKAVNKRIHPGHGIVETEQTVYGKETKFPEMYINMRFRRVPMMIDTTPVPEDFVEKYREAKKNGIEYWRIQFQLDYPSDDAIEIDIYEKGNDGKQDKQIINIQMSFSEYEKLIAETLRQEENSDNSRYQSTVIRNLVMQYKDKVRK